MTGAKEIYYERSFKFNLHLYFTCNYPYNPIFRIYKKVPVYESFTEGAKEGFKISIQIIPYLVAIMAAVSMLRASGAIEALASILHEPLEALKIPADALPLMLTRSLSGGATLGIFSDIVNSNGANSYAAKLSAVIVGSSETTFYVLSVYFGAIGIKKIQACGFSRRPC